MNNFLYLDYIFISAKVKMKAVAFRSKQHRVARAHSRLTTASYPQHPPSDLKTSGEWNTASAPIQSRRI